MRVSLTGFGDAFRTGVTESGWAEVFVVRDERASGRDVSISDGNPALPTPILLGHDTVSDPVLGGNDRGGEGDIVNKGGGRNMVKGGPVYDGVLSGQIGGFVFDPTGGGNVSSAVASNKFVRFCEATNYSAATGPPLRDQYKWKKIGGYRQSLPMNVGDPRNKRPGWMDTFLVEYLLRYRCDDTQKAQPNRKQIEQDKQMWRREKPSRPAAVWDGFLWLTDSWDDSQ